MRKMLIAAMSLAISTTPACAGEAVTQDIPRIIPGGKLDPAYPDADVYLVKPPQPVVPPGRACALAARYVDLINAGRYADVAALYADDATFLEPMRPSLFGREQIDEFYSSQIGGMKPRITAVSYFGDDTDCVVSLSLQTAIDGKDRWVLVSVDHFTLQGDGKIASMVAYGRPARGSGQASGH